MLIPIYNAAKAAWSRVNDWFKRGEKRAPVPALASPADVAAHIAERFIYTGDTLADGKIQGDFWLHPERLYAAMLDGPEAVKKLMVDCDDLASLAFLMLSRIPGCRPQLYTLEDSSGKWGHHVVCGYDWNGAAGVIDTNGHRRLVALTPEQLCVTFTAIYKPLGYTYVAAVPTDYPF